LLFFSEKFLKPISPPETNIRVPVADPSTDRQFHIGEYIHKDQSYSLVDFMSDNTSKGFVADNAASIVTGIVASGFMNLEFFHSQQLAVCRDTIVNLGFDEISETRFEEVFTPHRSNGPIVILVTGCQEPRMLERRIIRLVRFTIDMHEKGIPFEVVFSGRHPERESSVTMRNESVRMETMYISKMREMRPEFLNSLKITPILFDANSSDTRQNIEEFVKFYVNQNKKSAIVIISSTFHLIRIAKEFKNEINKRDEKDKSIIPCIMLVGAEDEDYSKKLNDSDDVNYLKLMLFDIYFSRLSSSAITIRKNELIQEMKTITEKRLSDSQKAASKK
jgi:DUF218 domain